ncbi:membrane-spanning 4-domains subfamily A member 4A [Callorhinus ursinus]|uniref:Membrane-spanning 4-domains subfamily A member 4A n=1 Tax=Callorhinus ursinus TaxID=34884 RepID=A0A3Q7PLF0_CALUR|nr:membrane-spanning 4-domains subfamily A member 4A [Callorhinus ursinus]
MATTQGLEGTTGAGPGVYQPEKSAVLHPNPWKGIPEKFLKGDPKVLGVVQILIALMKLSLGIININVTFPLNEVHYLSEHELYKIVGSLMAGKGSLKLMNKMRISLTRKKRRHGWYAGSLSIVAGAKTTKGLSIDVMVILLSVLEFCIAVSLSAFGCNVTCCHPEGVVFVMPSNPHMAETASSAPFAGGLMPPTDQQQNVPENPS